MLPPERYAALRRTQVAEGKALGTVDEIRVEGLERQNPEVVRALVSRLTADPEWRKVFERDGVVVFRGTTA